MSNVEFLEFIMERGSPVVQLFIIDAIGKWADKVAKIPDEELERQFGEHHLIPAAEWKSAALYVQHELMLRGKQHPKFTVPVRSRRTEEV